MSDLITEHLDMPPCSRLRQFLPKLTRLFLPLDLTRDTLDDRPPTFKEIRHILNVATTNAIAGKLKLLALDADDTSYEDGGRINRSSRIVQINVELIRRGTLVSLLKAAGYPGNPSRYEQRLRGLSRSDKRGTGKMSIQGRRVQLSFETYTDTMSGIVGLREIDGAIWNDGRVECWHDEEVTTLLNAAEMVPQDTVETLHLSAKIYRKDRAIGIINTSNKRILYENLEEISLTLQHELRHFQVPLCAFSGGNDVWVDIGNKVWAFRL
ncbi:hypothetical protein PsorP6_012807 [Peronosclerospora sorghi]|uniref:Uncharacterized protein n=1 Tax=Peronosclerospora sorghi TaxID=230839 RepID=A0ACC0WH37_9STRA|nr:hypothetical protein PsorP6_012807 [Peronosclerospora sorghi]